ncbi:hypothetical protein [Pseudobutyrivibrio xylanivorans]|uniref:hypothetical protein n=1 Tax=Pseudobutyrivibrio xylanivorans TaxID=185007 RepID=UPI00124E6756|nr:hypothetical protein [Pseudobutyrivibrio xylanivorans]
MIVATRPEPTVLPPSRFMLTFIVVTIVDFSVFLFMRLSIFASLFAVFKVFGTRMVPSPIFLLS